MLYGTRVDADTGVQEEEMKERFNWVHTGGPFGDATDNYVIEFDKPLKVSEFIEYVRSLKEYAHFMFDNVYPEECELDKDGSDIKPCPEKYLDREIESIDVNGGWWNFGYKVKLVPETDNRKNLTVTEKTVTSDNYILLRLSAEATVGYKAEFFHFDSMRKLTLCIDRNAYDRILACVTETEDGVVPFYELTLRQKREQWEWGIGTKIEFSAIRKTREVPVPVVKGISEEMYILDVFKHAFPEKAKEIELERNRSAYMCMLMNGMMPRMEVL